MPITSKVVPNLIQGVSQQAAQQRRDSQAEAQYDCLNSPKDGSISRHGADLLSRIPSTDLTGAWLYELFRGDNEHYLVAIKGGVTRAFDLNTGVECTVNVASGVGDYLSQDGGSPRAAFCAQTVDDYTFIATKHRVPALAGTTTPARPKEALIFFRAGAYSSRYTVAVIIGGTVFRYSYVTPDNSTAFNAKFITTNQLAATFFRAMSGLVGGPNSYGTGSFDPGDTGGSGGGTPSELAGDGEISSAGFYFQLNGNLIRIWRTDNQEFSVDTSDSVGDTYITAIKDDVASFSSLPKGGFEGFTVRVRGKSGGDGSADYYVAYVNKTAATGYWREVVKPGVLTTLNPDTMPHALVNTGPGTFEVRRLTWSTRIAGDGEISARNPGFVGKPIRSLFYHKARLGILTEATADWSKARNPYTFFPDTAQAVLADAPIGIEIAAGETIALLRKAVLMDEALYLWAQRSQFRINSGSDPFRADTVAADKSMSYEFAENSNFPGIGTSVYFATEPEDYATIRNLQLQQGRGVGDVDVTDHVSEYIPAGVRKLSTSDTGKLLLVQSDGAPNRLYLYNFLVQDRQIVQSAWNTWRLPAGTILWSSVFRMYVYIALQRADGVYLLKLPLRGSANDPGGKYRTRLDLRVSEAECAVTYDPDTQHSSIQLPYSLATGEEDLVRVAVRTSLPDGFARGRLFRVVSASGSTVTVDGDLTGYDFYVGLAISSERIESTFYLRGPQGVVPTDSLMVREFIVSHDKTGYYRIEVDQRAGREKVYDLKPVTMGETNDAIGTAPGLVKGTLSAAVDCEAETCTIRMVNDSILPSRWQTAEYRYEAVLRAVPTRIRNAE